MLSATRIYIGVIGMPNRILKESICVSDQVNQLSWFEEAMFYRLMVNADDYGRYDGRPAIIRSRLFPLKDVRDKQIEDALAALSSAELVEVYVVDGRPFVRLTGWDKHQTIRAKKSKYPAPDENCDHMKSYASKCNQMQANVSVIQSNTNPIIPPYNPPKGEDDDDDLLLIAKQNDHVYDRAKECGFASDTATLDRLTDLIAKHGHQAVLDGLDQCVEYGAKNLAYLRKVVEGQTRRDVKTVVNEDTGGWLFT